FEIYSVGVSAAMAVQEKVAKTKHIEQAPATICKTETAIKTSAIEVSPILQLPSPPKAPGPKALLLQRAFGVFSSSVPTSSVPMMAPAPVSENPTLLAFRAVSSIKIAIRDAYQAGDVIDIVIRAGAVPSGGVRFLLQDEAAIERVLLEEAV